MHRELATLVDSVIRGTVEEAVRLTRDALAQGCHAEEVLREGLLPGMDVVGQRFKGGDMFIPQVLASAKVMHRAMDILRPHFENAAANRLVTMVIGTVKGDVHDIGKNLVAMMMRGAGYNVIDLGVDQGGEKFVAAIEQHGARLVGLSALLTTTMREMENIIDTLRKAGLREQVKVMVGGAPVSEKFAGAVGADGYAPDAITAVEKVKELVPSISPRESTSGLSDAR